MNKKVNIFLNLVAAAFAVTTVTGCDDSDDIYDPEITFSKTGEVAFIASIENCQTRASLVNTGEARWLKDDAIGVVCTDGSVAELKLDGTGETRRAMFRGLIPDGKELGSYALHPSDAVFSGDVVTVQLPAEAECTPAGTCSVMVSEINGTTDLTFRQMMSYINIRISNISPDATKIVLSSEKNLSGTYSLKLPDALGNGLEATDGSETITIILPEKKETSASTTLAIPVGTYSSLMATTFNAKDQKLAEVECLQSDMQTERAQLRKIEATLPKVNTKKPPIEGTVLVAGIYWAPGNLQYYEGTTADGFQAGWRLAPNQWHYVNCENAGALNKAVTFKPSNYNNSDHFNWGGIAKPFDKDPMSSATAAVGTDIAGQMFTSQDCTVPTTDFSAAKYGDLAFWATKGKFRLPTQAEYKKLYEEASIQYGSYKVAEGKFVTGFLFFDPEDGEEPTFSDEVVEFTEEDMARGLFLPKAGRRYNSTDYQINVQGTQGVYWTSGVITGDGATEPCYGAVFSIQNAAIKYPYWNKAFDAKAGFSIRPVYIE